MEIGGKKGATHSRIWLKTLVFRETRFPVQLQLLTAFSFFPDMNLQLSRNLPTRPIYKEKLYSPPRATLGALSLNLPVDCHIQDTCGASLISLIKNGENQGDGSSEALWDVSAAQILKLEKSQRQLGWPLWRGCNSPATQMLCMTNATTLKEPVPTAEWFSYLLLLLETFTPILSGRPLLFFLSTSLSVH